MNKDLLEKYYGKFCEDKRLLSRHGIVEFKTSMKYIDEYLSKMENPKILDDGAGTGRYSLLLEEMGYDVTALELCRPNLGVMRSKSKTLKTKLGNAMDLSSFKDETFDLVIMFGPMYHIHAFEEKLQALNEAKRVTKKGGYIFVCYCMNEYAFISYAIKEKHLKEVKNKLDEDFSILSNDEDLYSYMRLEDINKLNEVANLKREKIISQDGPTDYIRMYLNQMDEEDFATYIEYHLATCERYELLGAGAHVLDILRKDS